MNSQEPTWARSVRVDGGTSPQQLVAFGRHVVGWILALLGLFWILKLVAIGWFLWHGVDPFSDYQRWKIPLLLATDLSAAVGLGLVLGVLSAKRAESVAGRGVQALARWSLAIAIVAIAAVNLRVIEAYRAVLDRYLLAKVGNLHVMSESFVANIDFSFLVALGFGVLAVAAGPTWIGKRASSWLPGRALTLFGGLLVLSVVPLAVAHRALSGHETFGLKHNAVLALINPRPDSFQYADPAVALTRLQKELPRGPQLSRLAGAKVGGAPVEGPSGLRGRGKGYNVLVLLLESVGARYVDETTMPNLTALRRRSLQYANHHTNAVNTFDAHYSLFRSVPVRGDAFAMRELHQGLSRDVSIMEVMKDAGYSVGMFHASFLNFIDTRWVWQAPGVDKLVDAQEVVSASRPGWSWGANDADVADVALSWVNSLGQRPFFLVFNPSGSHHPYLAPRDGAPFPGDTCEPRYKSALYAVDQAINRFLVGLQKSALLEHTIVAVVSDHGELIDERSNVCGHGISLVDEELRVPFFIHVPGQELPQQPQVLETSHWDFAPTMASLLDVPAPEAWLGRNLLSDEVTPRATFVGLNYCKHAAVVADGVIGDLDVGNDRMAWRGAPPPEAKNLEELLRSLDSRVTLQHVDHLLDPRR